MARLDILTANDRPGSYPDSHYAATTTLIEPMAPAKGDMRADVVIIGAGFTGLSAALHMAKAGLDVVLLDAHRVGFGASGRNGGQVGTGQRLDQDELEQMLGKPRARELWDLAVEAVSLTKALAADHAPEAGFMPGVIHADHKPRFVAESHAYARKLQEDYGHERIHPLTRDELHALCASDAYHGGYIDTEAGHLNPLAYAVGLARAAKAAGARIYEMSRVTKVTIGAPTMVETDMAKIRADHVLWAANGYLGHAQPQVAARVMPINNFIVATEPLGDLAGQLLPGNHAVADSKFVINYFRLSPDGRMLFGGTENSTYRFPKDIEAKVRVPMGQIFPELRDVRVDHAWGGTLAITVNRMPHFARLAPNVLSASGFSGHGVALATLAGKLAAEAVAGLAGRFDLMADVPSPRFPGGARLRTPLLVAAMFWFSLRDKI